MKKACALAALLLAGGCGGEDGSTTGPGGLQVVSVAVSPDTATIERGDTLQLEVTVTARFGEVVTDRQVSWQSSDVTVATVDEDGRVAGLRGGVAGITATSEGVSGNARVTVRGRVATVDLNPDSVDLVVGGSAQLSVEVRDQAGNDLSHRPLVWESSDPMVVDVDDTGLVSALDAGSAEVTATAEGVADTTIITSAFPIVFAALEAGSRHTCGVDVDSVAYCWGSDSDGQLGQPGGRRTRPGAVTTNGLPPLVSVSAGDAHTCAIDDASAAWCWGRNGDGQLGDGSVDSQGEPTSVSGGFSFSIVSAGSAHTCGVTTTDEAYCWGRNDDGQLGDNTVTGKSVPEAVKGGLMFDAVSAGGSHTCGVTTTGELFCWGLNDRGQLGDGTNLDRTEPMAVSSALEFSEVSAGSSHTCALTTGGDAYCWGANDRGQLGDGTNDDSNVPVAVSGGLVFSGVSAGDVHSCGVVLSDNAYCWGGNDTGQLGDFSSTDRSSPVGVDGDMPFTQVTAGESHSCGLVAGPLAYCWGLGNAGQLGAPVTSLSGFVIFPVLVEGQQ